MRSLMMKATSWLLSFFFFSCFLPISLFAQEEEECASCRDYYAEGMERIYSKGKYAFRNEKGEVIADFIFDETGLFKDGYCTVRIGSKMGMIDKRGKFVIPCEYDTLSDFSSGLALFRNTDGRKGYINKKAKEVLIAHDYEISDFVEGYAVISFEDPSAPDWPAYNFINKKGKRVSKRKYDKVLPFNEGYAPVMRGGYCGMINTKGKEVLPLIYSTITPFSHGAVVAVYQDSLQFFDRNFKRIDKRNYDYTYPFRNGLAIVYIADPIKETKFSEEESIPHDEENSSIEQREESGEGHGHLHKKELTYKVGAINLKGQEVIPCIYDQMGFANDGYVWVEKGGWYGIFDSLGKQVLAVEYENQTYCNNLYNFSEGLALVEKDLKFGFVNKKGEIVIPLIYDWGFSFQEGLACMKKGIASGFINQKGDCVIPFIYELATGFKGGRADVVLEGRTISINQKGECVRYCKEQ